MIDGHIEQLAQKFRQAIEVARNDRSFVDDYCFKDFPSGCCGDTSYFLAEYLLQEGIETIWVSTQCDDWTHAWLVLKDSRVRKHKAKTNSLPDDYVALISRYDEKICAKQCNIFDVTLCF